ncbi:hypothetical protein GGI06_004198 [Coemansia sp. S85]|nr:hypothetical protein GGI06_004198 [Coemansia sp. S85]
MPPSLALSSAALKAASAVDADARSLSANVRSLAAAWDFSVCAPSALKSIVDSAARDLSAATINVLPLTMELALPGTFDPACAVMVDPAMAAIIDPESVTLIEPRTVTVVEAGAVTVFDTDIAFSHVAQSGVFYEAGFSEVGMDDNTGVEWGGSSEILHSLLQDAGADFNVLMDILNLELAQHQDDKDVGWEDLL